MIEQSFPHIHIDAHTKTRPQYVMAGPCSAETETQVLQTAKELAAIGIDYFRAGIWKPRTSPGSFEGVGVEGLSWLAKAKTLYGIKVATEVATAKHVEEALTAGIDLLWIGARTTVNPFAVQEIADALQGVNVPVMVKNPINPDLALWIGAMKRLMNVGITDMIACHRGFHVYEKTRFRNAPLWEIPLEFKRKFPDIPLICDPSHICGNREMLTEVAQKAMDFGYEGVIIETHPTPDAAWSDAAQQITPTVFAQLLAELTVRKTFSDDIFTNSRLLQIRDEIDTIDERLIELLAARMQTVRRANTLKEEKGLSYFRPDRWAELQTHCSEVADKLGMNQNFVVKLFDMIHLECIGLEKEGNI